MESSSKNRIYLLKEEKVSKALLKLGVPTMIGMAVTALYNLVDAFFVGQLGEAQMGAITVAFPLSMLILGIALLFGGGASSYLSRLLGKREYQQANGCASVALITSLVVGGIAIILMIVFLEPILIMLGATDTILPYAKEYGSLFIIGLIFNIFNITVNNIFVSEGAAKISMIGMLIGGVINIIFDPIFIFTFDMGVEGAAIATILSRFVVFVIFLLYILANKTIIKFSLRNFKPSKPIYSEIFKIGFSLLMFQILASLSIGITNKLASNYGDSALASIGIVSRITALIFMIMFGVIKGYQTFVGYNYGAKNYERVKKATKTMMTWCFSFSIAIVCIILLFHTQIMQSFGKDNIDVIEIGVRTLLANSIMLLVLPYVLIHSMRFLALGKAKQGGIISLSRQGLLFIPLVYILTALFGLNGLIITQSVADVFIAIITVFLVRAEKKAIVG